MIDWPTTKGRARLRAALADPYPDGEPAIGHGDLLDAAEQLLDALEAAERDEARRPATCGVLHVEPGAEGVRCGRLAAVCAEHHKQALALALEVETERDEARANARILAHAYSTDNAPPGDVLAAVARYPMTP